MIERENKHDVILCICNNVNKHKLDVPQKTRYFASIGCMSLITYAPKTDREREADKRGWRERW